VVQGIAIQMEQIESVEIERMLAFHVVLQILKARFALRVETDDFTVQNAELRWEILNRVDDRQESGRKVLAVARVKARGGKILDCQSPISIKLQLIKPLLTDW
jgi:hypothetical protein